MKEKFKSIARKLGIQILSYESKRSDMGVQSFEIRLMLNNGKTKIHNDGYFVGESGGKEKVLKYFEYTLSELNKS